MAANDNVAVVRRFADEVLTRGNLAALGELFTPGFTSSFAMPLPPGLEGMTALAWGLRAGFPDLTVTVDPVTADGDQVAAVWSLSGAQTGEFMGIPPTGRPARWTGIVITRFEDGRMAEAWGNFDQVSLLTQLGVLPGQPAPATQG